MEEKIKALQTFEEAFDRREPAVMDLTVTKTNRPAVKVNSCLPLLETK